MLSGNSSRKYSSWFLMSTILVSVVLLTVIRVSVAFSLFEGPLDEVAPTVTAAGEAVTNAKNASKETVKVKVKIEELSTKKKAEDASVRDLETLDKYLKDEAPDILKKQKDADDGLATQKTRIQTLIGKLEALQKTPEIEAAIKKLKEETLKSVNDQITADATVTNDLKSAAANVYKTADSIAKELPKQIKALTDQPADVDADTLREKLASQFSALSKNITLRTDFLKIWTSLEPELKSITTTPAADPKPAFSASQKAIDEIVNDKLLKWMATIQADTTETNRRLLDMRVALDKDVRTNSVPALKLLEEVKDKQKALLQLQSAAKAFAAQLKNDSFKAEVEKLDEIAKELPSRIGLVNEGLAGDFTDFIADFVPLYYFTDVFNLMKILNPEAHEIRDVSALRDEAAAARRKVDKADLDLVDAQAQVDGLQTRVRDLEEELQEAQRNFLSADDALVRSTRRVEELESRPDKDQGQITRAKQRQADAQKDKDSSEATRNKLQDEKTGLPLQIAEARKKLLDAQQRVRTGRNEVISLAQMESEAFAAARDNEPVFFAPIRVTSKDPLQHVLIHAFSGRKVIHLRGTRENVDRVKDIITLFDRPAPQARLNLWTLELNSTADKDGARKFNESLETIEAELSNTRSEIAAVLSYLRDCINEEVNAIAQRKLNELEAARIGFGRVREQTYLAPNSIEDLRWARLFFYQKEVLFRLGFDPEKKSAIQSRNQSGIVNRIALPDPAGTTTLGESLIVLTLANAASRFEIMKHFTSGIDRKLRELGLCPTCQYKCGGRIAPREWFSSTIRALDASSPYYKYERVTEDQLRNGRPDSYEPKRDPVDPLRYYPATYAYTSQQKEIVNAITMAMIPRLLNRLRQLKKLSETTTGAAKDNIESEMTEILIYLWDALGVNPLQVLRGRSEKEVAASEVLIESVQRELAEISRRRGILRTANAQVARTDLMLRQMINAVDEDMDRHFVQPMMVCLREKLVKDKGIGLGIINRTSVLATNRLVARVDARSSAQLAIGEEQDALQAAQQLANLYLSAQTGNVFGGIRALGGISQRSTSEVYGLTSGSVFKVTPIFDPTGQVLRFKFDYVLANLVQDPDGSINPQLPRIERHAVNTEVELNNFELREISRFNTNARLGIPTTRKGGIPVVKDIPGMKYVPLLGWFVKRSGTSAVIQQSLMMGQTTMYPTIADIFDLLNGDDYFFDTEVSDCCKGRSTGATMTIKPGPGDEPTAPSDSRDRGKVQEPVKPTRNPNLEPRRRSGPPESPPEEKFEPSRNPDLRSRKKG